MHSMVEKMQQLILFDDFFTAEVCDSALLKLITGGAPNLPTLDLYATRPITVGINTQCSPEGGGEPAITVNAFCEPLGPPSLNFTCNP